MNNRHLAIPFRMALPLKNGIIMAGPGTKAHVEEVYEAATAEIPLEVWEGRDDDGARLPVGIYAVYLEALSNLHFAL